MFIAALKTRWHRVPDVQIERNLRFVSRSFSFDPHQSWIFISGLYADDITEERAPGSIKSDEHPGRTTSHWIQAPTSRRGSPFFFKMCHSSLVSFVSLSIVYIGRNRTEISKNVSTFPPTIPLTSTVSLLIAVRTMVARKKKKKKKDRDESIIEKLRGVQQNEEKRCLVILEIVSSRMGFRTFNE